MPAAVNRYPHSCQTVAGALALRRERAEAPLRLSLETAETGENGPSPVTASLGISPRHGSPYPKPQSVPVAPIKRQRVSMAASTRSAARQ
jgi:hypothetical protein